MRKNNSILFVVFMLVFVLCLTLSVNAKEVILRFGHNSSVEWPYQDALEYLAKECAEKTNGELIIEIYPNAQLGDQRQLIEGLQLGTVDGCCTAAPDFAQFVPEADVLSLPFLFRSIEHGYKVMDGPVGDKLAKIAEEKANIKVLGWMSYGKRSIFNSKKPIYTPEDVKGMKIRTMTSQIDVQSFNALGAVATPIPYHELYTALQQGVVEGAENDPINFYLMKFYEVCKYYSLTEHYINGAKAPLLIGLKAWNKLSDKHKLVIMEAAKGAIALERQVVADNTSVFLEKLKEAGVMINTVDRAPFIEKMKVVWGDVSSGRPEIALLIKQIQAVK